MKKFTLLLVVCILLAACAPVKTVYVVVTATPPAPASSATLIPSTGNNPNVSVNSGTVPNFDHIILIVLENRGFSSSMDGTTMPQLYALAQKNVLLTNYFAITHPSLPNYISIMSGSTQGITSDCTGCFVNATNVADEIEKSGRTWRAYLESMPSACFAGDSDPYAQKHNPLYYFDSIRLNSSRCNSGIVPLTQLDSDLSSNHLPNFSFVMPNLCNSGHSCPAATADNWVGPMVAKLQASPALRQNSLIIVTFDEASDSDKSSCCGLGKGGGKVATILISPKAKPAFQDGTAYSHFSLLKTILSAWGLPDLGNTSNPGVVPFLAPWVGNPAASANPSTTTSNGSATTPAVSEKKVETLECNTSSPGSNSYTVKICFTNPLNGAPVTGNIPINIKVDVNGGSGQVQKTLFYLDGKYILTSFYPPFSFILPSTSWSDGKHKLSVEAWMRDTSVTQRAYVSLDFQNGVSSPQSNTSTFQPFTGTPPQAGQPFIVAAVGDGAGGGKDAANVTNLIKAMNPNLFLYLGDVYERGSQSEFLNWYGNASTFFGQFKTITDPTVGNHDYGTNNAAGYFDYWNNVPSYYSFNADGWHFISLNSNDSKVATTAGSEQYVWLQQDLQKNTLPCTIVYYHHPLYNIGTEGPTAAMGDIWKLMAQNKVSIVLNGHDHDYQRWVALDGNGLPNQNGITEFVVGTGGHGLQNFPQSDPRVAFKDNANPAAFGALFLQLTATGANFSFENTDKTVVDSGVIPCEGAKADVLPMAGQAGFTAPVMAGLGQRSVQAMPGLTDLDLNPGTRRISFYQQHNIVDFL